MRVLVLGKIGSMARWTEETASELKAHGHAVSLFATRIPMVSKAFNPVLMPGKIRRLHARIDAFRPDLILAVRVDAIPAVLLQAVAERSHRPPMAGWNGDVFDAAQAEAANHVDVMGYTDTGLIELHERFGLRSKAIYAPHAARLSHAPKPPRSRLPEIVFVANPSPLRRELVSNMEPPVSIYGPGWDREPVAPRHRLHSRYIGGAKVARLYASHLVTLNIKNETQVLNGLNQRNFTPLALGSALLTDDQGDLARCFDPSEELFVYRDAAELNDLSRDLLRHPARAEAVAAKGRRRVQADHTYSKRLQAFAEAL